LTSIFINHNDPKVWLLFKKVKERNKTIIREKEKEVNKKKDNKK